MVTLALWVEVRDEEGVVVLMLRALVLSDGERTKDVRGVTF